MAVGYEEEMTGPRVLVINPPALVGGDFIDYPYFTSLGVLSNAAALREHGFSVVVADAQAPNAGERPPARDSGMVGCDMGRLLGGVSGDFDAVVMGVPPYLKPHARTPFTAGLFSLARSRFGSARLVAADCYFGGMHYIEYDGQDFLRNFPEVDAVVKYEGEAAIPALLKAPPGSAPRVARGWAAQIDPDDLPFPAWDLISVERYYEFFRGFFSAHARAKPFSLDLPTLPAVTSRGCGYRCAFCTANPGEKKAAFRPHSLGYLEPYFVELKTRFGARRLALLDGCSNYDPERFAGILDLLGKLGLRCDCPNGLRADKLTFGALKTLKTLAETVTVSAESADPEILLGRLNKGLDIESVARVAAWCRELALPLNIHYVIGCPGETIGNINRTLLHALRMKEEFDAKPLVQNFVPIPGAPLHGVCVREGLLRHFDPENIPSYFQGVPAIETEEFTRGQISRMAELFQRRVESASREKVIINLTYQCNNHCRFCAVGDREKRHGELKHQCRLLRDYRVRGITAVDLDGGEPTLYPHFFPLVRFAKEAGYGRISVTTNGRRLADRPFASRFLLSGITNLLISLHGHTPEIHEHHTRRQGSFQQTVQGIRHAVRLKPRRITLAVNTVITGRNAPSISDFFRFVRDLGVGRVNVQFVTPFGNAAALPPDDVKGLCRHLAAAKAEWREALEIELVNAIPCQVAKDFPDLRPEVGKHSRDMAFVDASPRNLAAYLETKRRKTGACLACEYSVGCAGFYVFGEGGRVESPVESRPS